MLAILLGAEFWLLHAEYLTEWRPGSENTYLGKLAPRRLAQGSGLLALGAVRGSRSCRGAGCVVCRFVHFPQASCHWSGWQQPCPRSALSFANPGCDGSSDPLFVLFVLLFLVVAVAGFYLWTRIERPGRHARMALLAGLIVTVCPLFTIVVAGRATLPRYYYQTCPAAVVLIGLASAGLASNRRRSAAIGCFVAASLWPNLDLASGGSDQVVLRQFLLYDQHNRPLLEFLSGNTEPGDSIAYFRNVKGMMANYYLPDRRWVNLLDADVEYNKRFRNKIPADQFDDFPGPDWFVLWNTRGREAKALDDRYELVWEHSYEELRSIWKLGLNPRQRAYAIYRLR